jgi:exo-beta-1,3-glucanase (GH17 family)
MKSDFDSVGLTNIPITVTDIVDTNVMHPDLITIDPLAVNFNQFPFWARESFTINNATAAFDRVKLIERLVGDRQIIISETGWADTGKSPDVPHKPANPDSMAKWLRDFVCFANERGWQYFWFSSYDSSWRRITEDKPTDVEGHFGLYYENGTMKEHIRNLNIDCSQPQTDLDSDQAVTHLAF